MSVSAKTLLKSVGVVVFVASISTYAYLKTIDFVRGPQLSVETPTPGETVTDPLLSVRGTAEHIAFLNLNGRQIYTSEAGAFREQLLLFPGYNIITVTARDRFDRRVEKRIEVVYRADRTTPLPESADPS